MRIVFVLLSIVVWFSCSNGKNNSSNLELGPKEPTKIESLIFKLSQEYRVKYWLDTIAYQYSIQFEDLINSEYQLASGFYISDIFEKDSSYYVSGFNTGKGFPSIGLRLKLKVSKPQALHFVKMTSGNFLRRPDVILLVDLKSVKHSDYYFNSSEGEEYCMEMLGIFDGFYGMGELIEVFTID